MVNGKTGRNWRTISEIVHLLQSGVRVGFCRARWSMARSKWMRSIWESSPENSTWNMATAWSRPSTEQERQIGRRSQVTCLNNNKLQERRDVTTASYLKSRKKVALPWAISLSETIQSRAKALLQIILRGLGSHSPHSEERLKMRLEMMFLSSSKVVISPMKSQCLVAIAVHQLNRKIKVKRKTKEATVTTKITTQRWRLRHSNVKSRKMSTSFSKLGRPLRRRRLKNSNPNNLRQTVLTRSMDKS